MQRDDLEGKESECWLHETRERDRMMGRGLIEEESGELKWFNLMMMMKPGRFLIRKPDGIGVARRVELVQHEEIAPRKEGL